MKTSSPKILFVLCILGVLWVGCQPSGAPPTILDVLIQKDTIEVGEKINLSVEASGGSPLSYTWSVTPENEGGMLNPNNTAAVTFSASKPGAYIVTLTVRNEWGEATKNINFEVVEPPPTPTLEPTALSLPTQTAPPETPTPAPTETPTEIPTPSPIPDPIACNHLSIAQNVFSLTQELKSFAFYGPTDDPNFLCLGVYDLFHSEPISVKLQYTSVGDNAGYFGLATLASEGGYNATRHTDLCLWVYAEIPNQAFRLQIKDTLGVEKWLNIIVETTHQWTQICQPLSEFASQGVELTSLENVNVSFNKDTSDLTIWVDDFEFKP
ncbi:MAG: hypothetical protein Fur0022_32360 [Anaerolineales bacterium]